VTLVATIQQVDAGVLNVGYAEAGPRDGPAVLLLHGWPYDIHAYEDVAALLARTATGDRPVPARLRHDALLVGRDAPQRQQSRWPSTRSR
jgi:pimeloyl-ACP methyl ester carboxylesterase